MRLTLLLSALLLLAGCAGYRGPGTYGDACYSCSISPVPMPDPSVYRYYSTPGYTPYMPGTGQGGRYP